MTTTDKKQASEHTSKHSWGARFRAAREAMNLSEKDAAARLHLKPHIINIIETESFADGPPVIFMRGYIRSYGRLLNLSEKELNQALTQLDFGSPVVAPTPTNNYRRPDASNTNSSAWSTAIVMLVVTGLVGMWWWNSHVRNAPVVDLATTATPVNITEPNAAPVMAAATPTALEAQTAAAPATNTAPTTATAPIDMAATVPETNAATPAQAQANPAPTAAPADPNATAQAVTPAAPVTEPSLEAQSATQTPASDTPDQAAVVAQTPDNQATPAVTAENNVDTSDAANADDNVDAAPAKSHPKKTRMPNLADAEMSVPEEGLDNEPSE